MVDLLERGDPARSHGSINLVGRASRLLRPLKRGVFRSDADLQAAIRFLEEHNQKSQAFTWTADQTKSSPPLPKR